MNPGAWTEVAQSVFGDRLGLAQEYAGILADEGIEWGLIGPREADRLWERHILNSVCVAPLIDPDSMVADIGSGAGLPGIPLAIAREDLRLDLVEPMQRRVDFLSMCVERLGLADRVTVARARVEDYTGRPDYVTCRAVASMTRLVELVGVTPAPPAGTTRGKKAPHNFHGVASPTGAGLVPPATLLAVKGGRAEIEVADAAQALARRHLTAEVLQPMIADHVVGTVVRVCAAD